jgi:hypothetical protein
LLAPSARCLALDGFWTLPLGDKLLPDAFLRHETNCSLTHTYAQLTMLSNAILIMIPWMKISKSVTEGDLEQVLQLVHTQQGHASKCRQWST